MSNPPEYNLINHLNHILRSLTINYKNWFVLFISCVIMCHKTSIIWGCIAYILCIFYAYFAHRIAHEPAGFFLNRAHIYHHEHTDWLSHAIQVCVELAASYSPIVYFYYYLNMENSLFLCDPYIFMFFSIFYTSTHNVNYGMFSVNKVHAKHHEDYTVNYGPDICDIIFRTKYPENAVENTDHYIPNAIVATIITVGFRYMYERLDGNKQHLLKHFLFKLYVLIYFIVIYFTMKQTIIDVNKMRERDMNEFESRITELIHKLQSNNM